MSVYISLLVKALISSMSAAPSCPSEKISTDLAFSEQTIFTLIQIVTAKKANPEISEIEI